MDTSIPQSEKRSWGLPSGRILVRAVRRLPAQEYLLYLPTNRNPDTPVLVSVHGISRNATRQAKRLIPICEKHGAVLVVPFFDKDMHPDYQRLGRHGRGVRADVALHGCLEEVSTLTETDVAEIMLIGFSGGAQFAHRYALAHPHRVRSAVVVAPGWYTFPDPTDRYPYGIRAAGGLPNVDFNPEQFLRAPIHVLVGLDDVGSKNLRVTERTNAQQGSTRLERARNWVAAMRAAASAYGMESRVSLTELEGVDHSFSAFCERGNLIQRIDELLFGHDSNELQLVHPVNDNSRVLRVKG